MSDDTNDGGSAFPYLTASVADREVTTHEGEHGMTLRDYFAAKALPSLLVVCVNDSHPGISYPQHVANNAYEIADAMLKAKETK